MKIALISDTHTHHNQIDEYLRDQQIDVLIHAGDGSNQKVPSMNNNELRDCLTWMESFTGIGHKIYVPGNHDTSLAAGLIHPEDFPEINILIDAWAVIFNNETGDPLKIYGSPHTPSFGTNWAFNCNRGKIDRYWKNIPYDTDILVTHGPPYSILDSTVDYGKKVDQVGCKSLLNRVLEVEPKYHVFGHLHDEKGIRNHGTKTLGNKCKTTFINPSIVDLHHRVVNTPIIIEM